MHTRMHMQTQVALYNVQHYRMLLRVACTHAGLYALGGATWKTERRCMRSATAEVVGSKPLHAGSSMPLATCTCAYVSARACLYAMIG